MSSFLDEDKEHVMCFQLCMKKISWQLEIKDDWQDVSLVAIVTPLDITDSRLTLKHHTEWQDREMPLLQSLLAYPVKEAKIFLKE